MRGSRLVTTDRVVCLAAPGTDELVESVERAVTRHGRSFTSHGLEEPVPEAVLTNEDTLGVVVGGDGTFLRAARVFAPREVPFVGVDAGTLGFLMVTPPDEVDATFEAVFSGAATVAAHHRVRVRGEGVDETGLNEVQFDPPATAEALGRAWPREWADASRAHSCLEVFLNGEYVGRYEGGGLLVNTPTGSTAMALSASGPLHLPRENRTLQLTPLHTHNVGARPLVFGASATLSVITRAPTRLSVDGARPELTAEAGAQFAVTGAERPAYLVQRPHHSSTIDVLTEKLGWTPRQEGPGRRPARTPVGPVDALTAASDVAREAALAAGAPVRRIYDRIGRTTASDELIASALSRSEQIITAILESAFPAYGVVSEGWLVREGSDAPTWLVDPLDGTGNFAHGNPSFTISLALIDGGEPVVGVVYSPMTDDLFHAVRGGGACRNDSPIEPTDRDRLDESMLLSGYDPTGEFLRRFYRRARGVRRLGCASLQLCYVAAGSADAHWEYDTLPWDVAAGLCILREAGGVATTAAGARYELDLAETEARSPLLASNGPLHGTLLEAFPAEGF